jgi:hypothetical protein
MPVCLEKIEGNKYKLGQDDASKEVSIKWDKYSRSLIVRIGTIPCLELNASNVFDTLDSWAKEKLSPRIAADVLEGLIFYAHQVIFDPDVIETPRTQIRVGRWFADWLQSKTTLTHRLEEAYFRLTEAIFQQARTSLPPSDEEIHYACRRWFKILVESKSPFLG